MAFDIKPSNVLEVGIETRFPKQTILVKAASDLVHEHYGSDKDAGAYRVRLYNTEDILPIPRVTNGFYHGVQLKLTQRWIHGTGLITVQGYKKWKEEYRKASVEHADRVHDAKMDFDNILERAHARLKDLKDHVIWPTAEQFGSECIFKKIYPNVTSTKNLRMSLTKEEVDAIENDLRRTFAEGRLETIKKLSKVLSTSARAQAKFGKEKFAKLRKDSVKENVEDFVNAFDCLNVAGEDGKCDAEMDSLAKQVKKLLSSTSMEELREDEDARNQSATDTNALVEKVEAKVRYLESELDGYV